MNNNVNNIDIDLDGLASSIDDAMNSFDEEEPQVTQAQANEAKNFIDQFKSFISGASFKDLVNEKAREYNVPPKRVAENFFERCLGMVGDILGIAIATTGNAAHTLVDVLSTIVHAGINLVVSIANGLASIISGNRTCVTA